MKLSLSVSPSGTLSDSRFFLSRSPSLSRTMASSPSAGQIRRPHYTSDRFTSPTGPQAPQLHPGPSARRSRAPPRRESRISRPWRSHLPLRQAPSSSASSSPRASAALWRGVADLLCLTADSSLRRAPRGRDGELLLHLRRGGTRGPAGTAAPKRGRRGSARASSRADCHPRSPRAREGATERRAVAPSLLRARPLPWPARHSLPPADSSSGPSPPLRRRRPLRRLGLAGDGDAMGELELG